MKKKIAVLTSLLLIISIAIFSGCIEEDTPSPSPTVTIALTPEPEQEEEGKWEATPDDHEAAPEKEMAVVNSSNQFALDLYSNLREEDGNVFFSPYSISTALAMTYEGARGETAEEIQSVFYFPVDDETRRRSFEAIHNNFNKEDADYKLETANALWIQEDYRILDEYIDTIEKYYGGRATNLDFINSTEDSRQTINSWVEEKTNNKIKDLFPQGSLDRYTRLVLTNAIYFKGDWVKQFDESDTRDEDFRVSSNQTVKVPMMRRTGKEERFNYTETEELQLLEMLYEGEELSMLILLPKNDDIESIEESLTFENLGDWKSELRTQQVNVFIPKFTFTTRYSLNENLKEMGMPSAFTEKEADFSGIDGTYKLLIQSVVHQAFVDVNEEGTEAAAATGVSFGITSLPPEPKTFRADHPFIFIIQERETGTILFLGRVTDPSQ
ncbi:MAG: serpin family protein [Halobacteriota archaeon]|nr:serpin family protein [Halobacteriota archaeon]